MRSRPQGRSGGGLTRRASTARNLARRLKNQGTMLNQNRRWLLFAFDLDSPAGGWADLVGGYPTLLQAQEEAKKVRYDTWEIVDLATMTMAASSAADVEL